VALFSPKARILLYILLVIAVFVTASFKVSLIILFVVLAAAVSVPLSSLNLKRSLLPVAVFLLFTFISNVLFQEGRVLYEVFGLELTDKGLRQGGRLTLRLFILIAGAKVSTASTRSEDLIKGMSGLLGPLGRVGFVQELVYVMSLTLRLLPVIYNEAIELYRNIKESERNGMEAKLRLSVEMLSMLFERSLEKAREMTDIDMTESSEKGG
jgi:energy-coupling factor transport system permease protein